MSVLSLAHVWESSSASVPSTSGPDLKCNPSLGRLSQLMRSSYFKENEKYSNYGWVEEKKRIKSKNLLDMETNSAPWEIQENELCH